MKKIHLPLFIILLLAACQKESVSPDISEVNQTIELRSQGNKVSVCHNGHIISININAVPAHKAHGDAVDIDDDGYFNLLNVCGSGIDCNDHNATIHPGATEVCEDGIDNNCDGEIDEDCIASVTICDQVWMAKNLNVSKYRNGDPIPKVTDAAAWDALTTGAYCYYNNDSVTYAATYGKLYNWYAVNDPRGLAPEGWHVPDDNEWTTLSNCFGGDFVAGGPLKETGTTHWNTPNAGATNISNFTGLPGGLREISYGFHSISARGTWWSSTEWFSVIAGHRGLNYFHDDFGYSGFNMVDGMSVRCVKD